MEVSCQANTFNFIELSRFWSLTPMLHSSSSPSQSLTNATQEMVKLSQFTLRGFVTSVMGMDKALGMDPCL